MDVDEALRTAASETRQAAAGIRGPGVAGRVGERRRLRAARWPAVSAVALLTATVIAVPLWLVGEGRTTSTEDERPAVRPTAAPTTPVDPAPSEPAQSFECGPSVPIPVFPPDGWSGPTDGPPPDASPAAQADQLVLHWSEPDGASGVEVRWPADPRHRFAEAAAGDPIAVTQEYPDGTAGPVAVGDAVVPGVDGACAHLQITFYGSVPAWFADRMAGLDPVGSEEYVQTYRALMAMVTAPEEGAWVVDTEDVAELPDRAVPCGGGDVPYRGGTVTTGTVAATPDEAFTSWTDPPNRGAGLLNTGRGYVRLTAPDGSVAFGKQFEGGPGYVGLVWVRQMAGGWVVDRWETSGC